MVAKSDIGVRCFQAFLAWGNFVIACCGLALMAMCIFFIFDRDHLYVLVYATGNDSIWRAAWIGLFTGFALFCTAVFGMYAVLKSKRGLLLVYILLMIFIFAFEVASAITAATHKDWFVPNLFLKQMLENYNKPLPQNLPSTQDEIYKNSGITSTWNMIMTEYQCCGVYGPQDWLQYNSQFRQQNSDSEYPWPRQCCLQDGTGGIVNVNACKIGVEPYLFTQGCYDYIAGPLIRQGLGVSWFGFAILCWTFFVVIGVMFYYTQLDS
ncbi:uroplakin-1b [Lepisosteus oculatus]|uniref:Uroplakin-1b n=1 Tax=Lepisosteus oculatus TaxID=7918 RepID=W5M4D6_LEPOC|nr:PREDICTED: uroplakin-1b [Lepisosteus oculatus]